MNVVNQHGNNSLYIEQHFGDVYYKVPEVELSVDEISENFTKASSDLSNYKNKFGNGIHIPRKETNILYSWITGEINKEEAPIAILSGNAGYGKSVILKDLFDKLQEEDIPVLGIKADRIFIHNLQELNNELELGNTIESIFKTLSSKEQRFVFMIDQIDALSQSLSSDRNSLNTYHRLIQKLCKLKNIRIVISCRIYDLNYDPLLSEYKNKKIFNVSPLLPKDVDTVLSHSEIDGSKISSKLKKFLSTPLHLELFTKIDDPTRFGDSITLQTLYDEIWRKFILEKPIENENNLDSQKIQELINVITDMMYEKQQLVIDQKQVENKFFKEITYLASQEILFRQENNKLQFIHQSFFDYAYARSFIEKRKKISESLKEQHQGLFIRSRINQVFNYLRESDEDSYIQELREVISGNYRFHIKLLLINNLGFYAFPLESEKNFVKQELSQYKDYLKLFIESIYSEEWFDFVLNEMNGYNYFTNEAQEETNILRSIAISRILPNNSSLVLKFLTNINKLDFKDKKAYIGTVLTYFPSATIEKSFELFHQTKKDWDSHKYYSYLSKAVPSYPQFVIDELRWVLTIFLELKDTSMTKYIPGDYFSFKVYKELYEAHPSLAIIFFIEVITIIADKSRISTSEKEIINSMAYIFYAPFKSDNDSHYKLYDIVLKHFEDLFINNFDEAKRLIIPLLDSDLAIISNLPVSFIAKYPIQLKEFAFNILSQEKYYLSGCEIFNYNLKELLGNTYSLFNTDEQETINNIIINLNPEWENKNIHNQKGVSSFGYTRVGYTAYLFLSMIPEPDRNKYRDIRLFHQEKERQYGIKENSAPKGIQTRIGDPTMESTAYEKMNKNQWKNSFRKYVEDFNINWDAPTRTGHGRMFESCVTKDPQKYIEIIEDIIQDNEIIPLYSVYGLQGLKNAKYSPERTKEIFNLFIEYRYNNGLLDREPLLYSIWLIDYFIDHNIVDKSIIDFLCDLVINYPDAEMLNNDPLNDGMNSVRGAATSRLVQCYKQKEFSEEIFTSLEILAEKGEIPSRTNAYYQLALLNHLDSKRNLELFLKLTQDYDPRILRIPLHNTHPLVYLIHVDFSKLIDFFDNAITVEGAETTIAHALFLAWKNNYGCSEDLLNKLISHNINAQKTVVKAAFDNICAEDSNEKEWKLIHQFINVDDEGLGQVYELGLNQLTPNDEKTINFLDEYVKSAVSKYKGHSFYQLLLKVSKDFPHKCIEWSLSFPTTEIANEVFFRNEPLQVLIQSYNAIRKYKKEDSILELAMDAFDEILKNPSFRGEASEILNQLDADNE